MSAAATAARRSATARSSEPYALVGPPRNEGHGKRLTYDFDALLVSNRLLGLGLRMPVTLGRAIAERLNPGQIMLEFLKGVIASAPDIDPAAA